MGWHFGWIRASCLTVILLSNTMCSRWCGFQILCIISFILHITPLLSTPSWSIFGVYLLLLIQPSKLWKMGCEDGFSRSEYLPRIPFTAATYELFFQVLLWGKAIQSWLSYHFTQAKGPSCLSAGCILRGFYLTIHQKKQLTKQTKNPWVIPMPLFWLLEESFL